MDWFEKHVDTVIILGGIISSLIWMNGKFTDIKKNFSTIEKEIAVVKACLIMKNIMPPELANKE